MGSYLVKFAFKMATFVGFKQSKMVILVRTDLNMGKGKIASQVAHAAVSLYQSALDTNNSHVKTWMKYGQPKIVLKIDQNCEKTLQQVYESALNNKLNVCLVRDAGRTQIDFGTATAVGIGPNEVEQIDKITSGFKLL